MLLYSISICILCNNMLLKAVQNTCSTCHTPCLSVAIHDFKVLYNNYHQYSNSINEISFCFSDFLNYIFCMTSTTPGRRQVGFDSNQLFAFPINVALAIMSIVHISRCFTERCSWFTTSSPNTIHASMHDIINW